MAKLVFLRCQHHKIFSTFGLFSTLCLKETSKYQTNACFTDIWTMLKVTKIKPVLSIYQTLTQSHKMVKHIQTIRRQIADELFKCI